MYAFCVIICYSLIYPKDGIRVYALCYLFTFSEQKLLDVALRYIQLLNAVYTVCAYVLDGGFTKASFESHIFKSMALITSFEC